MPSAQTPNGMPASRAVVTALGQETARTMCRFQVRRRQKAHRALCKKTPAHPRRGGYYAEFLILGALSAREAVERSETEGAIGLPRRCEADAWEAEVSPPAKIAWRLLREDKRKRRYFCASSLLCKFYSAVIAPVGQPSSQAPQSMQTSGSTTYVESPGAIAFTGQASAQAPQETQASEIL